MAIWAEKQKKREKKSEGSVLCICETAKKTADTHRDNNVWFCEQQKAIDCFEKLFLLVKWSIRENRGPLSSCIKCLLRTLLPLGELWKYSNAPQTFGLLPDNAHNQRNNKNQRIKRPTQQHMKFRTRDRRKKKLLPLKIKLKEKTCGREKEKQTYTYT